MKNDFSYQAKFRWLKLNKDNNDKAPDNPLIGNTLTPIAEDMLMLSSKVQYSYENWRFTLGGNISRSTYVNDIEDDNNVDLFINIEHNL